MAIDNGGWDRGIHLNNLQWQIASGGTTSSGIAPTPGSWEYVVGTFSKPDNSAVLYVGDESSGNVNTAATARPDAGNAPGEDQIELGRYDNQDIDGVVDDVFVFSGALTDHQPTRSAICVLAHWIFHLLMRPHFFDYSPTERKAL